MNNNYAIKIKNISHTFLDDNGKKTEALRDVSFEVKTGEFFSILGPSGCGKSTLLRILASMAHPTKGEIELVNIENKDFAMVFQNFALFPWLTVYRNVEFGLKMRETSEKERSEIVREHIKEIGLVGFEHAYPKDLSGGMRQRVGIARALATDPKILLMDEAFSALDSFTAEKLRQEVLQLWLKDKITILMVTHSVEEAIEMSDRVLVMTPRPGRVEKIIDINIPRPRDRRSKVFFDLVDHANSLVKF